MFTYIQYTCVQFIVHNGAANHPIKCVQYKLRPGADNANGQNLLISCDCVAGLQEALSLR